MKEKYFCTKIKKNSKKITKITEMSNQNVTYAGGGFFCSGYRSLIGNVLRFFSLKFRSLGGFLVESILGCAVRSEPLAQRLRKFRITELC
jgi:hypothetical protein